MICDSELSFVSGNYGPCDCFWSFCHDVRNDCTLFLIDNSGNDSCFTRVIGEQSCKPRSEAIRHPRGVRGLTMSAPLRLRCRMSIGGPVSPTRQAIRRTAGDKG
jgi:hypothetical protein